MLSEVTQLPPEVEQRREMERQAEMKRQMERLQKKEKHKSSSSYTQVSPSASWSTQNNTSAMGTSTVHVTKPVQSSTHNHEFCSSCAIPLGTERAMSVTSLGLLYHLKCFVCCVCHAPLATGLERTHVHVRNSRPHCKFCYSTETGQQKHPIHLPLHVKYIFYRAVGNRVLNMKFVPFILFCSTCLLLLATKDIICMYIVLIN